MKALDVVGRPVLRPRASTVELSLAVLERGPVDGDEQAKVQQAVDQSARMRLAAEALGGPIDMARAERAVADLLDALGVDCRAEAPAATAARMSRAYAELLTPTPFETTTFPNDEGYDELVVASNIPFCSLCEHHLLPFSGVAHVGYLPGARLIGLSKLARVVEHFARRLQLQQRLTVQVADWLGCHLAPKGVGVVLEADHTCMSLRGVRAVGARSVSSAMSGLVRDDQRTRAGSWP